jgi:hypothetical protein
MLVMKDKNYRTSTTKDLEEQISKWAWNVIERTARENPAVSPEPQKMRQVAYEGGGSYMITSAESGRCASTYRRNKNSPTQKLSNKMAISKPINILLNSKMKSRRQKDRCIKRQKI